MIASTYCVKVLFGVFSSSAVPGALPLSVRLVSATTNINQSTNVTAQRGIASAASDTDEAGVLPTKSKTCGMNAEQFTSLTVGAIRRT